VIEALIDVLASGLDTMCARAEIMCLDLQKGALLPQD